MNAYTSAPHTNVVDDGHHLTIRDRLFVQALLQGCSGAEAYRRSGHEGQPRTGAWKKLRQPAIIEYARACAEEAGLTVKSMAKLLSDATQARKVAVVNGQVQDLGWDAMTAVKAVELASKLSGAFLSPNVRHQRPNVTVSIGYSPESVPRS